jgi:hypothetical protein
MRVAEEMQKWRSINASTAQSQAQKNCRIAQQYNRFAIESASRSRNCAKFRVDLRRAIATPTQHNAKTARKNAAQTQRNRSAVAAQT